MLDACDASDKHREDSEHEAADERHRKRERQQQPCRDGAIETPDDEPPQARVSSNLVTDGAGDLLRRPLRRARRPRISACAEECESPAGNAAMRSARQEHDAHGCSPKRQRSNHSSAALVDFFMSQTRPGIPVERITSADHPVARRRRDGNGPLLAFPALDKQPGRLGRRLAALPGEGHPVWTYVCGILLAFALIASLSIVLGLVLTRVLLHVHGVASDDESFVGFLARHRSSGLTEASLVGSIIAGGVVLPIVAGIAALAACLAKHWRLAGFLLFALALESGSYRVTTLVVHRHRPEVHRLEKLPIDASYPSGHTAASIAVYGGIALLLTSRIKSRGAQVAIWVVAALIPVFVALSRMYRGMHHPLDVVGGVVIGIAALSALVLVTRAAGTAAE